jgi:hypothetical protein
MGADPTGDRRQSKSKKLLEFLSLIGENARVTTVIEDALLFQRKVVIHA